MVNSIVKYLGWAVAIVFATLYFQTCWHKCPVCPEIKQITGDTTYVPNQQPVKPDTASYVPEQKLVKASRVVSGKKNVEPELYFTDEYHKQSTVPYYEPHYQPLVPDAVQPCPLQTSTDTQRIADKGYVVIKDLIRGEIISRNFSFNISAATPTQEPGGNKPRARWYGGVEAIGTRQDWMRYAGIAIGYQPKNAKTLITIGGGYILREPAIKVGIYHQLNRNR